MTDYVTFVNGTALLLLGELPLQSLDSAVNLITVYISDTGGWIPVDPLHPTGTGAPANGFTEQQVADAVSVIEFGKIYDIEFQITLTLTVQAAARLSGGLSIGAAAASMANQVSTYVTDEINNSLLPLRVASTSTQSTLAGLSVLGGFTSQTVRQNIAAAILGTDKLIDYKALSLKYLQDTYGLNDTWNVVSVFTLPSNPINIIVKKYLSNTYATLDGGSTAIYVLNISPVTYAVVSGAIIE